MPYKVFKDGDQFCVHKLNADDSKGEQVKGGCHPTRAEAMQHKEALYVHVEDAKGGPSSGWHNPPEGTHTAENAPNFAGGPGADRVYDGGDEKEPKAKRCKCSKCGAVRLLEKGKQCSDMKCPACGGEMSQTEPREDKPAGGEEGRAPGAGRRKAAEDSAQETHACTCPQCGKTVHVALGQKCNEVRCPECKAMMTQGSSGQGGNEKAVHGEGSMLGEVTAVMGQEGKTDCKCPHCGRAIPCTAKACPFCKEKIDRVERGEGDKAMDESFEQQSAAINAAFQGQFSSASTSPIYPASFWLVETFEDAVIAEVDGQFYRISCSKMGDDYSFAPREEWVKVERKQEWVEKAKALKAEGILSKHGGGEKAMWTVYKSATGEWRWAALCNWAVVDKEHEVVSEKAYQDAIAHAQRTGQWGELDLVHVGGTDVGECDMLFTTAKEGEPPKVGAGGPWYDTPMATGAREAVQADPDDWGMSIKFRYNPQRKVKGIYTGDIEFLKYTILPKAMAASYGTAIAVQGGKAMKELDDKTREALAQLNLSEEDIAELAEKQKALPAEENVVEKDETPKEEVEEVAVEPEQSKVKQLIAQLASAVGIGAKKDTPVASAPEEAGKADEVTDPAKAAEPAETKQAGGKSDEADASDVLQAVGTEIAKTLGGLMQAELATRDEQIAGLLETVKVLREEVATAAKSAEERVEEALRNIPPVVKVAASEVRATVQSDGQPKGLVFGQAPDVAQKYTGELIESIDRLVNRELKGTKYKA